MVHSLTERMGTARLRGNQHTCGGYEFDTGGLPAPDFYIGQRVKKKKKTGRRLKWNDVIAAVRTYVAYLL